MVYNNINIQIRESLKAKRIAIRIISTQLVELIIPKGANQQKALQFLASKELWIRNKLRLIKSPIQTAAETLSILGKEYQLVLNQPNLTMPIQILDNKILISQAIAEEKTKLILIPFLKKIIKTEINQYALLKAQDLKVKYKHISIRDTSSRWGSCSSSGALSFSWRLVLAPRAVMEYVVIHELCHLIEMNHSHRFWKLVDLHCSNHHEARIWLKRNGKSLHSFYKSN